MRRQKLIGWSMTLLLLFSASPAVACGDKLLVLGQGVSFQIQPSPNPGAILFFMNPAVPGAGTWKVTEFQKIMKEAGHYFRPVTGWNDLETELKSWRYHLVIADFADAPRLEELLKKTSSQAAILPWVYEQPGSNKAAKAVFTKTRDAAEQRYTFVLERSIPTTVMSRVERSLQFKAKLARSSKPL